MTEHEPFLLLTAESCLKFIRALVFAWVTLGTAARHIPVAATYKRRMLMTFFRLETSLRLIPMMPCGALVAVLLLQFSYIFSGRDTFLPTLALAMGALYLQNWTEMLLSFGPAAVMEMERRVEQEHIMRYRPPRPWVMNIICFLVEMFLPSEAIWHEDALKSDHPSFYVANHTLFALEMGCLMNHSYRTKQKLVRFLGDHLHFGTPYGPLMRWIGVVDGTRPNVDALMTSKQNLLVYPGGSNEVLKYSHMPKYALLWKDRLGFARMAIKHSYPIIPVAVLGSDDMFDIMYDLPTGFSLPWPVVHPRWVYCLQKQYVYFGKPIDTSRFQKDWSNTDFARQVRDETKQAVLDGMKILKERQCQDPGRYLLFPSFGKRKL